MRRACLLFLSGVIVVTASLRAQTPEQLPTFEVASVKENVSGPGRMQTITPGGGRFVATNAPLKLLIADAYIGPLPFATTRILGGPEWLESARYDINAKASAPFQPSPGGPPREMLQMLRALLEDRFRLKVHSETRELPIYELVLARRDSTPGPELHKYDVDCDALIAALRAGATPPPRGPMDPPPCAAMRGPGRVLSGGIPMPQFATMLTNALVDASGGRDQGRLVVDKTGLTGRFSFHLAWTPLVMPAGTPPPGVPPIDPNGPSLFVALEEQLGLKLQPATGPLEVVVIDSIERPTPD